MTLIAGIRTTLRTVVGSATGLGEPGWYRTPTTPPTNQTAPGWSVWATVDGQKTHEHEAEVADPRTGKLSRRTQAFLRISDTIPLINGSQWSADRVTIWAVEEKIGATGGTAKYLISRSPTERGQAARGGGV